MNLYVVEVGERGVTTKSIYSWLKDHGLFKTINN